MKKRNLLLVILAVLLVFGLVMSCGPAEDEDENKPDPNNPVVPPTAAEKAAKYFGKDFRATYKLTAGNAIESVKLTEKGLEIKEISVAGVASTDFLSAAIDTWEDVTTIPTWGTATDKFPAAEFKIGFKVTGYITDAQPKNATTLYGSKTAPGYKLSDIADKTAAVMYFYILDDGDDLVLVRSVFSKDGTSTAPVTGSDTDASVRVYEVK